MYIINIKYFSFTLLFLLCLLVSHVQAQEKSAAEPYQLKGRLLDAENEAAIPFAHITNLNKGLRTLSDSSGVFNIPASKGDSLLVSSVSYGRKKVVVPAEPEARKRMLIRLTPNVYELDEVVVNPYPSEQKFKEQLLSLDLPEEQKPNILFPEYQPKPSADGNPSVGLGSPVSAIAGLFSKKERGRAFKAEIQAKDERRAVIRPKYNREIVREITGLEDEDELDAFLQYCVLSEPFLYNANEYEIHERVLGCFKDFIEQEG